MSELKIIAKIRSPYKTKFGIPRQSGLAESVEAQIVFEPEFRNADAVRGIEEWSHLWLIWQFSENLREDWSPTVRPPRLGGNTHVGVFATRSPYRPNAMGLSCVKLKSVDITNEGAVLTVLGADLMDGTPILDIKPYVPYADCKTEATGGFTDSREFHRVEVNITQELGAKLNANDLAALREILSQDPRPQYHRDPERDYGMSYGDIEVKFRVCGDTLTVISIE